MEYYDYELYIRAVAHYAEKITPQPILKPFFEVNRRGLDPLNPLSLVCIGIHSGLAIAYSINYTFSCYSSNSKDEKIRLLVLTLRVIMGIFHLYLDLIYVWNLIIIVAIVVSYIFALVIYKIFKKDKIVFLQRAK